MAPYIGYDSDTTFIPGTLNTSSSLFIQGGGITQTGGDVSFDSGTLFIDEDVNRVGIGTINPGTVLDIRNDNNANLQLRSISGADRSLILSANNSEGPYLGTGTAHDLRFFVNNGEVARIKADGNVGIGTDNPANKVSILVGNETVLGSNSDGLRVYDGTKNIQLTRTGSSYSYGGVTGTGSLVYSYDKLSLHADTSNPIIFATGGQERFRIDSNGRVSINDGTRPASDANAGAQLRVTGTPITRAQYYSPAGDYFGSFGYTNNTHTKAWIAVDSDYNQGNAVSSGIFLSAFHGDATGSACGHTIKNLKSDAGGLVFSSVATATSTGNPAIETERVRITTIGNVGIGTTNPTNKLYVYGDAYFTSHVAIGSAAPDSSVKLRIFGSSGAGSTTILGFGKTGGYGEGSLKINYINSGGEFIHTSLDAGTDSSKIILSQDSYDANGNPGSIRFLTRTIANANPVERLRITSTGNVGIGTTDPSTKLHVLGNTRSDGTLTVWPADGNSQLNIRSDSNDAQYLWFTSHAVVDKYLIGCGAGSNDLVFRSGAYNFATGVERLRITGGGNVGIGTTNPFQKLDVNGSIISNRLILRDETTTVGGSSANYNNAVLAIGDNSGPFILFDTNEIQQFNTTMNLRGEDGYTFSTGDEADGDSINVLNILKNGNIGINTTNPYYILDVRFNNSAIALSGGSSGDWGGQGIRIENTNTTPGIMALAHFRVSDGDWHIGNKYNAANGDTDFIFLQEGVNERLRIKANGNVGIGTTNPASKLHVYGESIRIDRPAGDPFIEFYTGGSSNNVSLYGGSSTGFRVFAGGNERLRINSSGAVGIGITNPSDRLHIIGHTGGSNPTAGQRYNISRFVSSYYVPTNSGGLTIGAYWNNTDVNGRRAFIQSSQGTDSGSTARGLLLNPDGGNVGIGTTDPQYKLEVNGSFAATTKSFIIPHPTKPGYKLRHGSLEGPENGVYVRGRSTETIISLPDYWAALVDADSITITLTPIGPSGAPRVERIENNKIYVFSEDSRPLDYFYMVNAERVDVAPLEVEIPPTH